MSSLRLMGKWGVPVATAVAVPIFGPSVFADSGSKDSAKTMTGTSRMIRPSELPIYEEPEEVLDFEYHGRARTSLEETVGAVREEIEGVFEATRSTRERVVHVCETGKAHTMVTIDYISDEENMLPRVGAITIGGLAGLVLGARKKGGLAKKAFYTSAGITATASMCYPRQAYQISQQAYGSAKEYANIGYNFVAGVKPQSKVATPEEPKKEPPVEPAPVAETPPTTETPPAETASTESEGGEVRSVLPQAIPDEKFPAPVDSLVQQASDVMQWGFRLTDKESNAPSIMPAGVVPPTESLVPEGFGAVREGDSKDIVESATEQVTVPKESCSQTEEAEVPDTIDEIVEKIVEDIAEKVGEDIVEDVAVVVKEVAEETLESIEEVAKAADLVENITERVSSTIDVIQEVLEVADKAAEEAGLPDTLIDVSEVVVEGVERVVDAVNVIAGKVEEVAEAVVEEIKDLKDDAIELVENEEKREELVEKIIDYVKEITPPAETSDLDKIQTPEEAKEPLVEEESKQLSDAKTTEGEELDIKRSEVEDKAALPDPVGEVTEPAPCITDPVAEVTEPTVEPEEKPVTDESLVETAEPNAKEIIASAETMEPDIQQMSESPEVEKDMAVTSGKEDKDQVAVAKQGLFSNLLSLFTKDKEEKVIEKTSDVCEETAESTDKGSTIGHLEEPTKLEPESTVAPEVLPLVEKLAEDIVEKAGEKVVEEVAEIVEEIAKEAEKDAEIIAETAEVVGESGEEAAKCVKAIEVVAEAADEAAKDVPGVPEIVGEISEKIDAIAKESEAVIDTVVAVAEKVEETAQEIGQEAKIIEAEAAMLVESEEKREELVEKVIEFVGGKLSEDSPKKEVLHEVVEAQVESQAVKDDEIIEPSQTVAENVEAEAVAEVKKEGLFDKLVNLFKDKDAKMEKPEGQMVEDVKELVDDVEQILKPLDDDGEKKPTGEEILKSDEVLDQKPTEEVEEQKPAEAELQNTLEVPVSDTELKVSVEVESLPQVPVETTVQEPPILTEPEPLAVVKTEDSLTETAPETQSKEGGLVGKLIDFFSNEEKTSPSEQVSGKEEETSNTELVTETVELAEVTVDVTPVVPLDTTPEAVVETTPEILVATTLEIPLESPPEVPVETASELPVETTTELPEVSIGKESNLETPVETTVQETSIEAEPEVLPVEKTEESVVETATETKSKEGGLMGKLIDFFANDDKTSQSEQVSSKDEKSAQSELVIEPVGVAEVSVDSTAEVPLGTTPETIVETNTEVPVEGTPELPLETAPDSPVIPEIPVDTVSEVLIEKESVSEDPVETTVQEPSIQAEPEVLPVGKTEESVVETTTETKSNEGGLVGKLIDFFANDEKTSHSEQVSGKEEEASQSELVTEPVSVAEVSTDTTPAVSLDSTPEGIDETMPEAPVETTPDSPVNVALEVPVDTISEVPIETQSILEAPVETKVEEPSIQAERDVFPVEKEDPVVETATETKSKEGGLIGKLIDFFANDEKTSHSEQVSSKDEETSQSELVTEPVTEPVSVDEASTDTTPAVSLDSTPEGIDETMPEALVETTLDVPVETSPAELETTAEVPVETEVKEVKGGLVDKLVNLFSSDKASHTAAETVTDHPVEEEQPVIISEAAEPASEVVVTEEKSAVPEEIITKGLEEGPTVEAEAPVPQIESVESKENVDSGLVGKLVSLFSKKEENVKVAEIEIVETPGNVSDDKVTDESDFVIVEHSDVPEDKDIVADPSGVTTEIVEKSSDIAESKDIASDDSGKSEGLFGKLRTFMTKSEVKEDPKLPGVDEPLVSEDKQEAEPEVAELPSDVKIEAEEITTKADTDEASSVSVEGSGGLFSSFGTFFTKEKSEVVESVDDSSLSGKLDNKDVEESTQSEIVISEPETPTLEVKDKSLFDKIAELISTNEDKPEGSSDETLGSTSPEGQTEPSQEELPQPVPVVDADQQKPLSESSDVDTKPSLLDRVTSLFSKDSEHVPIEKQSAVNEESTESSSSPDSKTATSDEDAEVFVVLAKPSIPVETPAPEDGQKEAEKATGWLQGSWFRSSASVSEEGKDIIIQVAPETPGKDYGQSNPEDEDMYTTRK